MITYFNQNNVLKHNLASIQLHLYPANINTNLMNIISHQVLLRSILNKYIYKSIFIF